ncbi:3-phosphoserine aminotransferase [Wickerhamomyces ciferrii]|uniref:Phosphoserine aminotransferase n=1 Tax=Wickerhamomyces ciferrii (strain ATCC 14091 / BCRC 22168 / CBS 111 / JCM 3599 / NBRC 0793 / NRRL Y-1031 F-60-10) TaxID=1206466 RepID=K0K9W3_WICCF|nr:3-phosphoserine aminotransferase [Wickerhamomyces ciferrii]CCH41720.1 3-phosphoserine aminotransferase [Wickerhamomyces ciferrii]
MSQTLEREEPHYFGAGPAVLPTSVLQQAAYDLINYQGIGLGVGEISHRSGPANDVIENTKKHFKELLSIPDTHEVFFLQGGGTSGFSSIATNLLASYVKKTGKKGKGAYAITGSWSKKAYEEAERLGVETEVLTDSKKVYGSFGKIQPVSEWKQPDPKDTAYVYYCDNETVNGVEFQSEPQFEGIEIVADLSSNILSRKVDVSKYGLILAGAQKNVGLAGLTVYIIKNSLLEQASDDELKALNAPLSPIAFHYPTVVKNNSAYNTIPIFTLHILDLVLQNLIKQGGLTTQQEINERKAKKLYEVLDQYPQLFNLPVDKSVRSNMNVVFTINGEGLEESFLKEAGEAKLTGLKGHRSVGGIRASLYNAVTEETVDLLVDFVKKFAEAHK